MAIIEWDTKYNLNIRKIDKQHRKIVSILNDIYKLRGPGEMKPKRLEKIIDRLISYIRLHFSTEEAYLIKHRYPDFQKHKSEHDRFISKVCEFQANFYIHKSFPVINLFNFVWDWFSRHILVTDKEYQLYFDQEMEK